MTTPLIGSPRCAMQHAFRSFAFTMLFLSAAFLRADDWPQWLGPKRDSVWRETGIVAKFPPGGPKVLWRVKAAGGYAGPSVAGGKVYLADYVTSVDTAKVSAPDKRPEID